MHLKVQYWCDGAETPVVNLEYKVEVNPLVRNEGMCLQLKQLSDRIYKELLDKFHLTDPTIDSEHG